MDTDHDRRRAVEALEAVGLTEYEARSFVALSRITTGTAADVSEAADVPRTRVYDLAERLQERGLVEIRDGHPREFRAVDPDFAVEKLQRAHRDHLETAVEALRTVTTTEEGDDASGVWRLVGRDNVIERGQHVAARAEEELFGFFTEAATFREGCFRQARYAVERGVDVTLGASDEGLRSEIGGRLPEATVWSPSIDWRTLETEGSQLSRLVVADRRIAMVASVAEDREGRAETAIWGEGPESELVVLCRGLVEAQLDATGDDEESANPPL